MSKLTFQDTKKFV